jgi:hypothetical protein
LFIINWADLVDGQVPANQLANATVDLSDYATEEYVDDSIIALGVKEAVDYATIENIEDLSSVPQGLIDGLATNAGDRILVKDQENTTENGIYVRLPEILAPALTSFGTADVTNTNQSVTYNKGDFLLSGVNFSTTQGSYVRLSGFNVLDANGNLDPQGAVNINGDWPINNPAGGNFVFSYSTTLNSVISLLGSSYASNLGAGTIEIDFVAEPVYPLARAEDASNPLHLQSGSIVFVKNGNTIRYTSWLQTGLQTVDFSWNTVYWKQIFGPGTYVAGNGILLDNLTNSFSVDPNLVATREYVNNEIADLVSSAPETLDTLNELAAALGDDANYATTITTALGNKAPTDSPTFTGNVDFTGATVTGIQTGGGTANDDTILKAALFFGGN